VSFIEGSLQISPPGDTSFYQYWCKVDQNQFAWCASELAPSPLGSLVLKAGG
jgi:hypothetical protein